LAIVGLLRLSSTCGATFDVAPDNKQYQFDGEDRMQVKSANTTPTSFPQLLRLALAILISLTSLALGGCDREGQSVNSEAAKKTEAAPVPEVNAITIAPKTLPVTFEAVGQTEGSREVEVRARVGGILLRRFYNEGSWVKQGTALFKIDPAPFEAALNKLKGTLAQEEAQLEKAKRDEARLKPLFEENAVSRKDYEDAVSARETAQARVQSARAGVTEAQLNLDYTNVQAPINGVTGIAEKSEGSLVAAGTDLLTRISQVEPIYANFSYSETVLLRAREEVAAQQLSLPPDNEFKVELRLADGSVYPQMGRLNFNDFRVQSGTGTIQVRAVFPNPKRRLLPGQFVRVTIHGATRPNAILIPQAAVINGQKGKLVYIVEESGKAEARPIETGEWREDQFLVAAGLKPGERVITSGVLRIQPGMPVKIVEASANPGPQAPPPAKQQ
jgi:membrane fusion protein, multidrug efflux system